MITQVVAIKDQALDVYAQPFHVQTIAQAKRMFQDEVNRRAEDNALWKHPEHFTLHHLGQYDNESGQFENIPQKPILIEIATNVKEG